MKIISMEYIFNIIFASKRVQACLLGIQNNIQPLCWLLFLYQAQFITLLTWVMQLAGPSKNPKYGTPHDAPLKVWKKTCLPNCLCTLTRLISVLPSKWNARNIFALTGLLSKRNISDFPPCWKMASFVTEFVIFLKTSK